MPQAGWPKKQVLTPEQKRYTNPNNAYKKPDDNINNPDSPDNPELASLMNSYIHSYDNPDERVQLASLMNIYIHSYDNPDDDRARMMEKARALKESRKPCGDFLKIGVCRWGSHCTHVNNPSNPNSPNNRINHALGQD